MAQVLKEEVRNRILESAEKVFYKKDYRGAKLTEIVNRIVFPEFSFGVNERIARFIAAPMAVPCVKIIEGLMDDINILAEI